MPCIQPTCTISNAVDAVTGELILDVNLDAVGGLACDAVDGIGVQRLGNVAPVAAGTVNTNCVHRILVTDSNLLYVEPRPMLPEAVAAGATVDFVAVGDHVSQSFLLSNTTGCPVHARVVCQQPHLVLVADPIPEPESPPGSLLKHLRWQGTTYIDSTVANINGVARVADRHDLNIRVPDGDDGNTHQIYHQLETLIPLFVGQSTTIEIGVNTGLLQGFKASGVTAGFTAERIWFEIFRTGGV